MPADRTRTLVVGAGHAGISLVTAAQDCRIDAVVAASSFTSLGAGLNPRGVYKLGWSASLLKTVGRSHVNPLFSAATVRGGSRAKAMSRCRQSASRESHCWAMTRARWHRSRTRGSSSLTTEPSQENPS